MNSPLPKVAIVLPSGDMVHKKFAMSLAGLVMNASAADGAAPPVPIILVPIEGCLIDANRNMGVAQALHSGADFVLFLDSDMVFPPWTLRRLLASALAGNDIVGATYSMRVPPFKPVGEWPASSTPNADDLLEADTLGTGCMLIARRVFESGSDANAKNCPHWFKTTVGEGDLFIGEDIAFCLRARAGGFKVMLDIAISMHLGHIGQQVFYLNGPPRSEPTPIYGNAAWAAQAASPALDAKAVPADPDSAKARAADALPK